MGSYFLVQKTPLKMHFNLLSITSRHNQKQVLATFFFICLWAVTNKMNGNETCFFFQFYTIQKDGEKKRGILLGQVVK